MKAVYFNNSKNNKLSGRLSGPIDNLGRPVIVLCHGLASSKESYTCLNLERILNNRKISTFGFDFYGHGQSDGKFEDITVSEGVDDTLKAIEFLKKSGYQRIGLFGGSFGGISSIIAASKTKNLSVLALNSPASDFPKKGFGIFQGQVLKDWKDMGHLDYPLPDGTSIKLGYDFFKDGVAQDVPSAANKIIAPTLIVHGDEDKCVPVEQSKSVAKIIPNCKLEILSGSDHGHSKSKDYQKMLGLVSEFIVENC